MNEWEEGRGGIDLGMERIVESRQRLMRLNPQGERKD